MSRAAWAVIGAVLVLVVSGTLGYEVLFDGHGQREVANTAAGPDPTPGPDLTLPTATAFLRAWAAGDVDQAASLTDSPDAARTRLNELNHNLPIAGVTLAPHGVGPDGSVAFTATLNLRGLSAWTYDSEVPAYSDGDTWRVRWSPAIINPHLTDDLVLRLGSARSDPVAPGMADRDGHLLTAKAHPSLSGVLRALSSRHPARPPVKLGTAVQLVTRGTTLVQDELATVGTPVLAPPVRTTIDAQVQAAAEKAVGQAGQGTGLVAVRPSTGEVLAVANNPGSGFDTALLARLAPGSTMKVITTAALLRRGTDPAATVACPPSEDVDGKVFGNAGGESFGNVSLVTDFAVSCNTAFISLRDRLPDDALADEAATVFGVTAAWDLGIGAATYGSVPPPADEVTKAADMIGQGEVLMSPLAMASVAATVEAGAFHQPVLVSGTARHRASHPMSPTVAAALRSMMHQVVTRGTAAGSLGGLPGLVGAKTGTAEVAGQPANGWMIAFRGDLAVGCVVQGGDAGEGSAGPVVRSLLGSVG